MKKKKQYINEYNSISNNFKLDFKKTDKYNFEGDKLNISKETLKLHKNLNNLNIITRVLSEPFQLLQPSLIIKSKFNKKDDKYNKLTNLKSMKDDNFFINDKNEISFYKIPFIPVTKIKFDFNKLYSYIELFDIIKVPTLLKPITITYFQILGSYEVKNDVLYPLTDIKHVFDMNRLLSTKGLIKDRIINLINFDPWNTSSKPKKINDNKCINKYINLKTSNDILKLQNELYKEEKNTLIFITYYNYYLDNHCVYEESLIHNLFIQLVLSLLTLKKGGVIVLKLKFIRTQNLVDLLYLVSNYFVKVKNISLTVTGRSDIDHYYVFTGFKSINEKDKKMLLDLVDTWYQYDKDIGKKLNVDNDLEYCDKLNNKNNKKFVKSLFKFDKPINKKFIDFIKDTNYNLSSQFRKYLDYLINLDKNINTIGIQKIIKYNTNIVLKWCVKYNVALNNFYETKDNKIIGYNKVDRLFPATPNINKIMITEEGVFSVTPPEEAEKITQLIVKEFKYRLNKDIKDCVITDATANIGGNTINFAKHFKKVNSIEISDINFKALKNNVNVYNLKNVNLIKKDFTKIKDSLYQDVIFFDPPWGGPLYKYKNNLTLYLSDIKISEIIDNLKTKYIALKAPYNVRLSKILKSWKIKKVNIYKIRNYLLLLITKS